MANNVVSSPHAIAPTHRIEAPIDNKNSAKNQSNNEANKEKPDIILMVDKEECGEECCVCLDKVDVHILKCGHYLCPTCCKGWADKGTCPLCRGKTMPNKYKPKEKESKPVQPSSPGNYESSEAIFTQLAAMVEQSRILFGTGIQQYTPNIQSQTTNTPSQSNRHVQPPSRSPSEIRQMLERPVSSMQPNGAPGLLVSSQNQNRSFLRANQQYDGINRSQTTNRTSTPTSTSPQRALNNQPQTQSSRSNQSLTSSQSSSSNQSRTSTQQRNTSGNLLNNQQENEILLASQNSNASAAAEMILPKLREILLLLQGEYPSCVMKMVLNSENSIDIKITSILEAEESRSSTQSVSNINNRTQSQSPSSSSNQPVASTDQRNTQSRSTSRSPDINPRQNRTQTEIDDEFGSYISALARDGQLRLIHDDPYKIYMDVRSDPVVGLDYLLKHGYSELYQQWSSVIYP